MDLVVYLLVVLIGLTRYSCVSGRNGWPAGKYALPQPKSGCPKNWTGATLFPGSNNDNIFYKDFHLAGKVNKEGVEQDFCVKKEPGGSIRWPAGRYCVLKRTTCPLGLTEGYFRSVNVNSSSTTVTNDPHKARNTGFCCSTKGNPQSPIKLPTDMPFYLYAHSSSGCQKVEGALVKEETVLIKSQDDSKKFQVAGTVPFGLNENGIRLAYCYYIPGGTLVSSKNDDDSEVEKTLFTGSQFDNKAQSSGLAVAIGIGIAGAMIGTAAIAFVTKRLMTKTSDDDYDDEPRPDED